MTHRTRWLALLCTLLLALAMTVTACGGDDEEEGGSADTATTETQASEPTTSDATGDVAVTAVWSGAEQKAFEAVIDGFKKTAPNVNVKYTSGGDQLPTVLSTAVEGGNPPDVAVVAQPGLAQQFVEKGALKPIDYAKDVIAENFAEDWIKLGTIDGQLYGLPYKGANKSTVWHNVQAFEDAGVEPATEWEAFLENAATLKESGTPAFSIGGADGWTLTDLFENLYLRVAGPEKYDQLATHDIPWTDESVTQTLTEMAKVFSDDENIAGGSRGALQTEFPKSVSQVFEEPPKAAMVLEGDFVNGVITDSTEAKPGENYDVTPFPAVGDSGENVVVGGGDMVVTFNDTPAVQAFVKYLATAEAAEIWAKIGGFASPNKNVDASVYPDDITRKTASALAEAETFRFDMSDLAPADFGGTPGAGEWKILQDFLKDSSDIEGTAAALEKAAAKAYK
jgi:ABC-type glycerol-3-phosphate transport system substrate-binding protein